MKNLMVCRLMKLSKILQCLIIYFVAFKFYYINLKFFFIKFINYHIKFNVKIFIFLFIHNKIIN